VLYCFRFMAFERGGYPYYVLASATVDIGPFNSGEGVFFIVLPFPFLT